MQKLFSLCDDVTFVDSEKVIHVKGPILINMSDF